MKVNWLREGSLLALALAAFALWYLGFERLLSDNATRVRYALRDAAVVMETSGEATRLVELNPNTWPDGCSMGSGYRLKFIPYQGNKMVPSADIEVKCERGRTYGTGTPLVVPKEIFVNKTADERVKIHLWRNGDKIEIIAVE